VPKLCQNTICLGHSELQFEREQLPQVVDNRHFGMELMEGLEPVTILRNPAGPESVAPCRSRVAHQFLLGFGFYLSAQDSRRFRFAAAKRFSTYSRFARRRNG
jgi:hypothetical protein